MKLSKKQMKILEYLGPYYGMKVIDGENCVYRNLGNGFDIEVSGLLHPGKRGKHCGFICVWDISKGSGIGAYSVEYVWEIKSMEHLKQVLDKLTEKYLKLTPEEARELEKMEI